MYDAKYVILIAIAFIIAITSPIWYHAVVGKVIAEPELELPPGHCIEDKEWMKANHMRLLKEWRDEVVRHADRTYYSFTYPGEAYDKNTETCFKCHTSKANFCDKCHDYNGVTPNCWDCHATPELVNK